MKNEKLFLWISFMLLFTSTNHPAISVIRLPDITDSQYTDFATHSAFKPVGSIAVSIKKTEKNYDEESPVFIKQQDDFLVLRGTATLIEVPKRSNLSGHIILTAAHVLEGESTYFFYFNNHPYKISRFYRPRQYSNRSDAYDIAIGYLSKKVEGIKPASLFLDKINLEEIYLQTLSTVGYGCSGRGDTNALYDDGKIRAFNTIVMPYKLSVEGSEESSHFAERESLFVTKFFKPRVSTGALSVKNTKSELTLSILDYLPDRTPDKKALEKHGLNRKTIEEITNRTREYKPFEMEAQEGLYKIKHVPIKKTFFMGGSTLGYSGAPDFVEGEGGQMHIISINISNHEGLVRNTKYLMPVGNRREDQNYYYPSSLEEARVVKLKGVFRENILDPIFMDKVFDQHFSRSDNQSFYNATDIHLFLPKVKDWMQRVFEKLS